MFLVIICKRNKINKTCFRSRNSVKQFEGMSPKTGDPKNPEDPKNPKIFYTLTRKSGPEDMGPWTARAVFCTGPGPDPKNSPVEEPSGNNGRQPEF